MNVAFYNPARGGGLYGREYFSDCSRDEVREMAMLIQIEGIKTGHNLGSALLVAWLDNPENYMGVFTLGDHDEVDESILDKIESLVKTRH